jgi:hypothetical protein
MVFLFRRFHSPRSLCISQVLLLAGVTDHGQIRDRHTWIRRIRSPQKAAESTVDAVGTYAVEFQEFLLFY